MALTRILNNQVSDSSAGNAYLGINAAAKLQDYSITSGKISNNLTYASNLTVTGNLDVQGTTTTIDTYNVVIEDPLLLLAKDQSGAPAFDIGYIGERGTSENIAFAWIEADGRFATAYTDTVTSNTTINITGYANLYTGNLEVETLATFVDISTGNISATGYVNVDGNVSGGNIISNALITGVTLDISGNAIVRGNMTVEGNLTYINVDDLRVEDPIIILGTGPNGNALTSDDGFDRGVYMEYYTTGLGNAFVGWQNSTGEMLIAADVDFASNNVVNINEYGTFNAGNASLQSLNLSLSGGNGNAIIGNIENVSGTSQLTGKVIIGDSTVNGANTANAALAFGATTSVLVPTGNSAQRPGTPVTGMLRFNTTTDSLEFYDADGWTSAGSVFTVVVSDQFTGNGVANTFTLSEESSTAGTIVAINGIVQIPTTAYAVSGNVLTFTEAPEVSDVIDARIITTTTTVKALQNAVGNAVLEASETSSAFNITGNLVPTANVTYNLGTNTARFNELWLAGSTIVLGNAVIKATSTGTVEFFTADGTTAAPASFASITKSGTNGAGNIGQTDNAFNTVFAKATSAQYADLAEIYAGDAPIEPGTVVEFGGAAEVRVCDTAESARIAGVVSTNPSYLMNSLGGADYPIQVALTGRVPTKVVGPVVKGDMMVAAGAGRAQASSAPTLGTVIGKALEDFNGTEGVIEVVVGRL